MRRLAVYVACGATAMVLSAGCGGSAVPTPVPGADALSAALGGGDAETQGGTGFTLSALPESFADGSAGAAFALAVEPESAAENGGTVVCIHADGPCRLRGVLCRVGYDAARYAPVEAHASPALGAPGAVVQLVVPTGPGVVMVGIVPMGAREVPVQGGEELARVAFRVSKRGEAPSRRVSSAPVMDEARAKLTVDISGRAIIWTHYLPGDYDQNGVVGLPDLVPFAKHFGEAGHWNGNSYDPLATDTIADVIDCNRDAAITLADVVTIAHNFGCTADHYTVFGSLDPAHDMPESNSAPSRLPPLSEIPVGQMLGDLLSERGYFLLTDLGLSDGWAYWVRPRAGSSEGTPSNYGLFDTAGAATFSTEIQPETYLSGTLEGLSLKFSDAEEGLLVDVWLEGAENLSALSAWVHFDPSRFDLVEVSGGIQGSVSNSELAGRVLLFSQSIQQSAGGESNLGRLRFARQPQPAMAEPVVQDCSYMPWYTLDPGVRMSYDSESRQLSWYYGRYADCDQDGLVLIDDILMIGRFFHQEPSDPRSAAVLADCNGNGQVEYSDLTPIAVHYGQGLTGYNVYGTMDPLSVPPKGEQPQIAPIGHVSLSEGQGDPFVDRLRFTFTVPVPQSGLFLFVAPERNGQVGAIAVSGVIPVP